MPVIRAVLIDIDGVLCLRDRPIPGSIEGMALLRQRGVALRCVTNTTRKTRAEIVGELAAMGFDIQADEVVTCALSARRLIESRGLRPHLLIHPGLAPEFAGIPTDDPNAVVIGDAAEGFTYAAMNAAFRVLVSKPNVPLIALANNRYFREPDGLSLDAGPFVTALEYAGKLRAEVTGKPSEAIFRAALDALLVPPGSAVMIGDDIESDVGGASQARLRTVLVRTGKYRAQDEAHPRFRPDAVADDFLQAVEDFVLPRLADTVVGQ